MIVTILSTKYKIYSLKMLIMKNTHSGVNMGNDDKSVRGYFTIAVMLV